MTSIDVSDIYRQRNGDSRSVKYLAALLLIIGAVSVALFAAQDCSDESAAGTVIDDLEYDLDPYTDTAKVVGYSGDPTDLTIPLSVTYDSVTYSVTSIGQSAFSGCTSLTSVTIPASVTYIGSQVFNGCTSLTSVTIPASVTYIGSQVFNGCTALASIDVNSGNTAFSSDNGVLFNKAKTELLQCPAGNARTSYTIPSSVTTVSGGAFSGCTALTSVTIADSVKSIGHSAFSGCTSLKSVTIPASVTSTGQYTFSGCTALTSVTISASLTSIEAGIFTGCTSLRSVNIPASVTSIGAHVFYGCTALTSVTIPASVTSIDAYAFCGCTSLVSVNIPASVTSIGSCAFMSHTFYGSDGTTVLDQTAEALRGYRYVGETADKMVRQSQTVTFDANGGSCDTPSAKTTDGKLSSLPTAARNGYTFDGWYTLAEGGEKITLSTVFSQDTTVYAHWTASSGGGIPAIAIVGAILAIIAVIGIAVFARTRA